MFTSCSVYQYPVHFLNYSSKRHSASFLSAFSMSTQPMKVLQHYGPLVNLRKADYKEGDRMVEMWAWLSPAWIMMWTLIQRDGQRDCGLRDCVGSGLWPGGYAPGSHGPCYHASHVFLSRQVTPPDGSTSKTSYFYD